MERNNGFSIVLTVLLLPWLIPLSGRAQPATQPTTPTPTIPVPRKTTEEVVTVGPDVRPSKKSKLEIPPTSDRELERDLRVPPLQAGDMRYPINLATALRLADARPIIVSAAGASAWTAEADLQKAKVLWIPTLNFAADYIRHDGYGPDLNRGVNIPQGEGAQGQPIPGSLGKPLNQNVNFFYGGGGFTYTPSTPNYFYQPVPGQPLLPSPQVQFLTDMIFEPLHQRQLLNTARWDIQTAKNDALFMTAQSYFNVHKYRGQYAGAIDTVQKGRKLVGEINTLAQDLVSAVEVDRARNLLADLEQQAVSAREFWRINSAKLTQVLRLDPRVVVVPVEHDHAQITMIDPSRSLDDLIPIGLTNRPELAAHQAMVQATLVAIRREKLRPLLPSVLINGFQTPYELIEVGGYGIGNGGKMNNWSSRDDISPQMLFTADQLGFGNLAEIKTQRGHASKALVELFKVQDMVAGDVTRTQADLQSAAARIVQAERELRSALVNYDGNYEGLRQTRRFGNVLKQIFRPQEVVFSLQLLKLAYDNYFATVADYNIAQFQLFHDLGFPARELAFLRPPGPILPVNTTRPGFLPPVGTGPPPATR